MKKSELIKLIKEEINDYLTDNREKTDLRKIRGAIRNMLLSYQRDLEKLEDMRRAMSRGDTESKETEDIINRLRPMVDKLVREIERYSHD
jgi:hypothetical protein